MAGLGSHQLRGHHDVLSACSFLSVALMTVLYCVYLPGVYAFTRIWCDLSSQATYFSAQVISDSDTWPTNTLQQ
jgi:hypothetical protein